MKAFIVRLADIIFGKYKWNLRCFVYNIYQDKVKMHYSNGVFIAEFKGVKMKFYEYPFYLITEQTQYFEHNSIKKDDIVIDGGVYMGTFAVYASIVVGENGKVILFEPDPINIEKTKKHIYLNNLTNIVLIEKGLWSVETILSFKQNDVGSTLYTDNIDSEKLITIPVTTLDTELLKLNIKEVNFIKLDIEGAEIEVINKGANFLKSKNIKLAIASYHIVNGEETYHKVENQLQQLGFKTITEKNPERITHAWR